MHHPEYELAATITRQSWLKAGMTLQELEHDAQVTEAFCLWVQAGHVPEEFLAPAIGSVPSEADANKADVSLTSAEQAKKTFRKRRKFRARSGAGTPVSRRKSKSPND